MLQSVCTKLTWSNKRSLHPSLNSLCHTNKARSLDEHHHHHHHQYTTHRSVAYCCTNITRASHTYLFGVFNVLDDFQVVAQPVHGHAGDRYRTFQRVDRWRVSSHLVRHRRHQAVGGLHALQKKKGSNQPTLFHYQPHLNCGASQRNLPWCPCCTAESIPSGTCSSPGPPSSTAARPSSPAGCPGSR